MKCGIHQDREAVGTCTECGIAFCDDCKVVIRDKNVCKKCVDKVINKQQQKNVALATVCSFLLPGAGQFYNGQIGKGILILLTGWLIIPWIWGIYDAHVVAKAINEGKIPYKDAMGCLIALLIGFVVIPGCALVAAIAIPNVLRAKISANDTVARETLSVLSSASERFAVMNSLRYPTSKEDFKDTDISYLKEKYCGATVSGFSYTCRFAKDGYEFVATPVTKGTSGTETYTIRTGGVLNP